MDAVLYDWLKALHVISVIAWMAGLLYLPRLFVYHCSAEVGSVQSETFKVMERRLLKAIMNPSMIASWAFGLAVFYGGGHWTEPWMHAKLAVVVLMTIAHMMMGSWRRAFAEDRNTKSALYFRVANEVPTVFMILIVIFVIVKPGF